MIAKILNIHPHKMTYGFVYPCLSLSLHFWCEFSIDSPDSPRPHIVVLWIPKQNESIRPALIGRRNLPEQSSWHNALSFCMSQHMWEHEHLGFVKIWFRTLQSSFQQANCNKSHIRHESSKWGQDCIFFPWQRHFTKSGTTGNAKSQHWYGSKLKGHSCEDINIIYNII